VILIAVILNPGKLSIILQAIEVFPDLLPVPAIISRFGTFINKNSVFLFILLKLLSEI
jgi:hypothetical protein